MDYEVWREDYARRVLVEREAKLAPLRASLPWIDTPIERLNPSTRARNALFNDGVRTVGQLLVTTEAELLRTPNFGRVSYDALMEALRVIAEAEGWNLERVCSPMCFCPNCGHRIG